MTEVTFALLSVMTAAFTLMSAGVDAVLQRLGWSSVAAYLVGGAIGGVLLVSAASLLPGEEDDTVPLMAGAIGGAAFSAVYWLVARRGR